MTTDTQPLAPTDEELMDLGHECELDAIAFGRADLAKWGTPPAVAGEQVDRADAVNLARNTLTQYDRAITKKGVRVLAEAVLSMDTALTTPQPTQAQAGAVPLTPEQIDDMHSEANRGYCIEPEHYTKAVRDTERAHGITHKEGGQHAE